MSFTLLLSPRICVSPVGLCLPWLLRGIFKRSDMGLVFQAAFRPQFFEGFIERRSISTLRNILWGVGHFFIGCVFRITEIPIVAEMYDVLFRDNKLMMDQRLAKSLPELFQIWDVCLLGNHDRSSLNGSRNLYMSNLTLRCARTWALQWKILRTGGIPPTPILTRRLIFGLFA